MKINDTLKVTAGITSTNPDSKSAKSNEASKVESSSGDKVTLSARAAELKTLASTSASDDTFDAKKVEAIKAAILDGQFKVDTDKVADGLISSVKDLLSSQKA